MPVWLNDRARTLTPAARLADGLLAGEESIDARRDVLQVRGVAAVQLRRHVAGVLDVAERAAHLGPVDVALAQVLPRKAPVPAIEVEVLQVDLHDAGPERPDPVLG